MRTKPAILRKSLGRAAFWGPLLGLVLIPPAALGWEFNEHQALGTAAYEAACKTIDAKITAAGNPLIEGGEQLKAAVCPRSPELLKSASVRYGRLNAFLADHISDPKKIERIDSQIEGDSVVVLAALALRNDDHFWPNVKLRWEEHHLKALELALNAGKHKTEEGGWEERPGGGDLDKLRDFRRAIYWNAFGDHFLQDAFSIGHSGFARAGSSPYTSKYFHDSWNDKGRKLKDRTGESWTAFGDGWLECRSWCWIPFETSLKVTSLINQGTHYRLADRACPTDEKPCIPTNGRTNIDRLVEANAESIREVIVAFLTGQAPNLGEGVSRQFPMYTELVDGTLLECKTKECWMDLDDPFPRRVYPGLTIGLGGIYFDTLRLTDERTDYEIAAKGATLSWNPFWPGDSLNEHFRVHLSLFPYGRFYQYYGAGVLVTPPVVYGSVVALQFLLEKNVLLAKSGEGKRALKDPDAAIDDIDGWHAAARLSLEATKISFYVGAGAFCDQIECVNTLEPAYSAGFEVIFGAAGGGPLTP
ncbi:MAG: hypothetical protein IIA41_03335 [SAR324 cluster bacterium]|nr:hypothetical protein [SAR324 cluster bacterium]